MANLRKDLRNAFLFRVRYGAKVQPGHKRLRNLRPFDQKIVMDALSVAIKRNDALLSFDKEGYAKRGSATENDVQISLDEIVPVNNENGSIGGYLVRMSYYDPFAADPGKKNYSTSKIQKLKIRDGEGLLVSAQMYLSSSSSGGPFAGTSRTCLEVVPGISRGKVIAALEAVAENYIQPIDRPDYEYKDKKGKKIVKGACVLNISHYPEKSESLETDLDEKELKYITFLRDPDRTDSLGVEGIVGLEESIVFKVEKNYQSAEMARKLFASAMRMARAEGYRMKAEFSFESEEGERKRTREVDLEKTSFADQLFSRKEPIRKDGEFSSIYEEFDRDVCDELIRIANTKEFWRE